MWVGGFDPQKNKISPERDLRPEIHDFRPVRTRLVLGTRRVFRMTECSFNFVSHLFIEWIPVTTNLYRKLGTGLLSSGIVITRYNGDILILGVLREKR